MLKFLLIILIIFLAIGVFAIGFISQFVRALRKRSNPMNNTQNKDRGYSSQTNNESHPSAGHQKVFSKEEGEYTDYEEIK